MISKQPKFLPEDGTIPKAARFYCKTCKEWWASYTGMISHRSKHPDHQVLSAVTNRPVGMGVTKIRANGSSVLDASARDLLLDYVLGKAKDELNRELDRMFQELKSQPTPSRGRIYVAR